MVKKVRACFSWAFVGEVWSSFEGEDVAAGGRSGEEAGVAVVVVDMLRSPLIRSALDERIERRSVGGRRKMSIACYRVGVGRGLKR